MFVEDEKLAKGTIVELEEMAEIALLKKRKAPSPPPFVITNVNFNCCLLFLFAFHTFSERSLCFQANKGIGYYYYFVIIDLSLLISTVFSCE
jgi:hypothetical protein